MENKRISFGYEDTDKKIEIDLYGLVFEVKNLDSVKNLSEIDKNDSDIIEKQIERILGEGSIEKINNKRVSDGYKKLDLDIELNILACIMEAYAKSMANNFLGRVTGAVDDINKDLQDKIAPNREYRRYNRNKNRRNGYRRY